MSAFRELFPEQFDRVVEWNKIARDKCPAILEQENITQQELDEFDDALTLTDVMDAVCDTFVTGAFLEYLQPTRYALTNEAMGVITKGINQFRLEVVKECLDEVLNSNDSKFMKVSLPLSLDSVDLIYNQQQDLIDSTGLDIKVRIHNGYAVFLDENNKVRKPDCFIEPDIESILEKHGVFEEETYTIELNRNQADKLTLLGMYVCDNDLEPIIGKLMSQGYDSGERLEEAEIEAQMTETQIPMVEQITFVMGGKE